MLVALRFTAHWTRFFASSSEALRFFLRIGALEFHGVAVDGLVFFSVGGVCLRAAGDRGSARAQTRFSESSSLRVLQKARTARYYIIHRRLNDPEVSAAEEAESTVVPAEYWEGLEVGERRGWSVANTFYAPADEKEVLPLVQRLTGKRIGQAICLFREQQDGGRGRFGMVPGRSCAGYIGVLYVLALENRPSLGFDGGSLGFDLCVSHRVLQDKVMAGDAAIDTLRIRTRVTVGTPCGVAGGLDKGLWGVAFFAARYPQARGIEGFPTGGDCPWPGALQLGAKCFLKTRGRRDGDAKNNFFAANAQCRSLAAAVGFDHDDASLAAIQNDMEFNLAGVSCGCCGYRCCFYCGCVAEKAKRWLQSYVDTISFAGRCILPHIPGPLEFGAAQNAVFRGECTQVVCREGSVALLVAARFNLSGALGFS